MRAREPDHEGHVERDGVRVRYEVHGDGETVVMLIPGWTSPLRSWKAQIAYLSRYFRVIAYDPRGTGRSDRPLGPSAYALGEHVADAIAIMDAVGARSIVAAGTSRGAQTALSLAVDQPERIDGLIATAPMIPLTPCAPIDSTWSAFDEPNTRNRISRPGIVNDFDRFAQWFVTQVIATDPHSTKQIDDLLGWLTATGPQAAADAWIAECVREPADAGALCDRVSCPVLVIHGDRDLAIPIEWGKRLAEVTGGQLMVVPGAGHLPGGRFPVVVNLAIREFVDSLTGRGRQTAFPDAIVGDAS